MDWQCSGCGRHFNWSVSMCSYCQYTTTVTTGGTQPTDAQQVRARKETNMSIDVKQMAAVYIKEHGYDGLCNDECGCGIDDLAPCGEVMGTCTAAFKGADDLFYDAGARPDIKEGGALRTIGKVTACPACHSTNVKCRGSIMNCEDCRERW